MREAEPQPRADIIRQNITARQGMEGIKQRHARETVAKARQTDVVMGWAEYIAAEQTARQTRIDKEKLSDLYQTIYGTELKEPSAKTASQNSEPVLLAAKKDLQRQLISQYRQQTTLIRQLTDRINKKRGAHYVDHRGEVHARQGLANGLKRLFGHRDTDLQQDLRALKSAHRAISNLRDPDRLNRAGLTDNDLKLFDRPMIEYPDHGLVMKDRQAIETVADSQALAAPKTYLPDTYLPEAVVPSDLDERDRPASEPKETEPIAAAAPRPEAAFNPSRPAEMSFKALEDPDLPPVVPSDLDERDQPPEERMKKIKEIEFVPDIKLGIKIRKKIEELKSIEPSDPAALEKALAIFDSEEVNAEALKLADKDDLWDLRNSLSKILTKGQSWPRSGAFFELEWITQQIATAAVNKSFDAAPASAAVQAEPPTEYSQVVAGEKFNKKDPGVRQSPAPPAP